MILGIDLGNWNVKTSEGNIFPSRYTTIENILGATGDVLEYEGVYFNTTVKIRTEPKLSNNTFTGVCYEKGESVVYHTVHLNKEGYNWIQYNRKNGQQGYCAITNVATGEKHGYAK